MPWRPPAAGTPRRSGVSTAPRVGEESLAHAASVVEATDLPVSADLENCFADAPEGVAATIVGAVEAGLAGCSIEDGTRNGEAPIYELRLAADRVVAAAEAAHGRVRLVLTARAENFLHDRPDLADTITRLQAFQEAGADVLLRPGLTQLEDIRQVVSSLDRPVNVLALPGGAERRRARRHRSCPRLGRERLRLRRPSGLVRTAAREFLHEGTIEVLRRPLAQGRAGLRAAFTA